MTYIPVTKWAQQAAIAQALARKIRDDDPAMVSEHFQLAEFKCKCGCGKVYIVPQLVELVEYIRRKVNLPIVINSGYRCPAHNEELSGTADQSKHCLGCAADLGVPPNLLNASAMLEAAQDAVASLHGGYHFYPSARFVHVDCWPWPPDRRW